MKKLLFLIVSIFCACIYATPQDVFQPVMSQGTIINNSKAHPWQNNCSLVTVDDQRKGEIITTQVSPQQINFIVKAAPKSTLMSMVHIGQGFMCGDLCEIDFLTDKDSFTSVEVYPPPPPPGSSESIKCTVSGDPNGSDLTIKIDDP